MKSMSGMVADLRRLEPRQAARQYGVLILFVALFVTLSIASDAFLTSRNLLNVLEQNAPLAIMAAAGTLVIVGGGFDLSTGAIFGVAAVTAAWTAEHVSPGVGIAVAPLIGVIAGTVNGLVITGFGVHSFLATLATSLVFRGLAILVTGGFLIPIAKGSMTELGKGEVAGIPNSVVILAIFVVLMTVVLTKTVLGRHVFAIGGNEEAARLSGVRVERVVVATFAMSGLAAGIAGLLSVAKVASADPNAGAGYELQAIAAIILGGTSIYGGEGAVWRSVTGVMLLALIGNGFNLLNADPFYRDLTTGVIIIFAVALAANRQRSRRGGGGDHGDLAEAKTAPQPQQGSG